MIILHINYLTRYLLDNTLKIHFIIIEIKKKKKNKMII